MTLMKPESIQRSASLLNVLVLAVIVWRLRRSANLLPGVLYLCISGYPSVFSIFLGASLRIEQKRGRQEPLDPARHTQAFVLLLAGWQLAIIGLLNMWPLGFSDFWVTTAIGYLSAAIVMILSYKLVAIADRSEQVGGSRPISYFGRPRSRRIFFAAFVYTPLVVPLTMMSVEWSNAKWCPAVLKVPQFWLLLVALLSAAAAGFVFQRYRAAERVRTRTGRIIAVVTLMVLGLAAAIEIALRYDVLMYALSSIAVVCIAASVYWLSLAREAST
jgi:hypothetical protein